MFLKIADLVILVVVVDNDSFSFIVRGWEDELFFALQSSFPLLLIWRGVMLKTFITESDIYYFNSENFTLSTSDKIVENNPNILKK